MGKYAACEKCNQKQQILFKQAFRSRCARGGSGVCRFCPFPSYCQADITNHHGGNCPVKSNQTLKREPAGALPDQKGSRVFLERRDEEHLFF